VPNPGPAQRCRRRVDPQSLNRYSYVRNNPLKYTDPSGHYSEDEIMQSFGVKTWDEVFAFFEEEGNMLSGLFLILSLRESRG